MNFYKVFRKLLHWRERSFYVSDQHSMEWLLALECRCMSSDRWAGENE